MALILDQYQNDHSSSYLADLYGNRWASQTFQAGYSAPLKEIKLYGYKNGTPANDLTVELRNVVGGKPGSTVHASTTIPSGDFTGVEAQVTATFSTPYTLTASTDYAIVCYQSGGTTGNSYELRNAPNDTAYGSGTYHYSTDGGSNWINYARDLYFQTYVEYGGTIWEDINCDIRVFSGSTYDINADIRVVNTITALRDINCDIRTASLELSDINCDIRIFENYEILRDINCDIRVGGDTTYDINCDIRVVQQGEEGSGFLYDVDCDIRVLDRELYDINCDIRVQENKTSLYDINTDIRVRSRGSVEPPPSYEEGGDIIYIPEPIGLDGFRVYLDGTEITDVEVESIKWERTNNETPASASFRLVRLSDNYNTTLENVSQAVNTNSYVEIKFNGITLYYGYVVSVNPNLSSESAIVNCLDRKFKIQQKLIDVSFGRKWEFPEQGQLEVITGDYPNVRGAITYLLNELVSEGIISSYSGIPTGIVPEYQETEGESAGTLLTSLLDLIGNYYWNITPGGQLIIYKGGDGTVKSLPLQETSRQLNMYDVLDYDLRINDINNLVTTVEVIMGTESEEERASYRVINASNLTPGWISSLNYDTLVNLNPFEGAGAQSMWDYHKKLGFRKKTNPELFHEVGRKWRLASWTDGSFIDTTFEPYVLNGNFKIGGWSWGGEYLTLSEPLLEVKNTTRIDNTLYIKRKIKTPLLIGRFYKKETVSVASSPSIFDVTWAGIGGTGSKRKLTLSQLGIRDNIAWTAYEDDDLVAKSEPGYDDTEYATDRANLMLSRINDPITDGTIDVTFDAFIYYALDIGKRVNLTRTNESNIYNGNNGFPLDILSISFDVANYKVTLDTAHVRAFDATVNYR